MSRPIFLVPVALAVVLTAMAWKLVRTPKPPLESERFSSTRLSWVDRSGAVLESIDLKGHYLQPRLSPDDSKVLLTRVVPGNADVWSLSMGSHAISRLTAAKSRSAFALWAPGGDGYFFSFDKQILHKTAAPESKKLFIRNTHMDWQNITIFPEDESADGRWFVFTAKHGMWPIETYLLRTDTGEAVQVLKTSAHVSEARISRDGNWIAVTADFTGRNEVYAVPIPSDPGSWPLTERDVIRVSEHGGFSPEWGPNRELLYIGASGDLMTTVLDSAAPRSARRLFRIGSAGRPAYMYQFDGFGVDADAGRFLIALYRVK